jgi:hypothetical protein
MVYLTGFLFRVGVTSVYHGFLVFQSFLGASTIVFWETLGYINAPHR